jgi:hypothetical protein
MDANQIEKLKALALAAGDWTPPEPWEHDRNYSDREIRGLEFCAAANPAAVDKLIAEVERLTCELQNQREITQHWKASAGYVAAPAAGTVEKDAERYQLMRAQLSGGDLDYYRLEGQSDEEIDAYCDTEIVAHTKAGKDSA